jgi:hypothetical protein
VGERAKPRALAPGEHERLHYLPIPS